MLEKVQKLIIGDMDEKRAYRKMHNQFVQREKSLSKEYFLAFRKIKKYMLIYGVCPDSDRKLFTDLLDLFEESDSEGKGVLEVIGKDISGFCDELMKTSSVYSSYEKKIRENLNKEIAEKFNKER